MLRRLTLGLFALACAAIIVACSSGNTSVPSSGGVPGNGPNFVPNTIYVSNTTQNAIELYTPSPGPSATPQYAIGGSNTGLNGPSYLAFDTSKRLYVTNYGAASKQGIIQIYQTYATGNVLPFGSVGVTPGAQPHGIAMIPSNGFAVAYTQPGAFFSSYVIVYAPFSSATTFPVNTIAGGNTLLNNPIGVAVDANKNIYVANSGGPYITVYPLPTPSPTPTGSPSPTPTPTATPTGSASPSPTPTPASNNIPPSAQITCVCFRQPTGLALDAAGNLFVTDAANAAVYKFSAASFAPGGVLALAPSQTITSSSLANPVDVKVDSAGMIYVVDTGSAPNKSMLLIFSPSAGLNATPATAIALPAGTATGLALSP